MKASILSSLSFLLCLSGCVRQPSNHALQKRSDAQDYRTRSDSALALLSSLTATAPKTVYVKTVQTVTRVAKVAVPHIQKETVYVREDMFPLVSPMVRPMPDPVYVRDTVMMEKVVPVERVSLASPKRGWSLFTIKRVVDTVYLRDTVYIAK